MFAEKTHVCLDKIEWFLSERTAELLLVNAAAMVSYGASYINDVCEKSKFLLEKIEEKENLLARYVRRASSYSLGYCPILMSLVPPVAA